VWPPGVVLLDRDSRVDWLFFAARQSRCRLTRGEAIHLPSY